MDKKIRQTSKKRNKQEKEKTGMLYPEFWPTRRWRDKEWEVYCFDGDRPTIMKFKQDLLWRVFSSVDYGPSEVEIMVIPGKIFPVGSPIIMKALRILSWAKLIKRCEGWWVTTKFTSKDVDYDK
jgi:hypothetical protein